MISDSVIPVEIDRSAETEILIRWADEHETVFPARRLRLMCPCAGCVDETTGIRTLDPDSVPTDVGALGARLVGRYGVEFDWSDGHRTGIYTFTGLRADCPCCRKAES